MTTWKVRSLRLTVFLSSEAAPRVSELRWEELAGAKPENVMNRGDQQYQEGPLGRGRLLLQKQQGRVDLLHAGFPQPEQPEDPVATLGTLEAASEALRGMAIKVLEQLGSCVRLAFGAEMVTPAQTNVAAYRTLVEHIGSATFKLEGGQEFLYQVNRPRDSKAVPRLLLNRLTRWHASSWQPVTVELTGAARVLSGQPRVGAVITTDVNTDGERTNPLPAEKLSELFDELRDLTIEIRDKGDIP